MLIAAYILTPLGAISWFLAVASIRRGQPSKTTYPLLALAVVLILAGLGCSCFITPVQ